MPLQVSQDYDQKPVLDKFEEILTLFVLPLTYDMYESLMTHWKEIKSIREAFEANPVHPDDVVNQLLEYI